MKIFAFFDSVGRDLRYALRGLPRRPTFTFAAIVTLAIGIGATTATFSVLYSVLLKPLPYPNSHELVGVRHSAPGVNADELPASSTMYLTYRDENRTFSSIGLWEEDSATLTGVDEPERVRALRVTHGTLQALAVQPVYGRWFTEREHEAPLSGPVPVVLSYGFWQRRFGGQEAAIGREFSIDSQPSQVVGVMPPDFQFLDLTPAPDVILPVRLDPAEQFIGVYNYQMLGRLDPGVTPAEARADLERLLPIWLDAWPLIPGSTATKEVMASWGITPAVRSLKDDLVGDVARMLWVLMGAIGAVLLIACANIANLMLVRSDSRRQEFAVRAALGAVPARIARELLVESFVLGVAGSMLGLALAYIGLPALVAIGPSDLPRLQEISVHPPVLAFTVAVSLGATLVFGSITALKHALHVDTTIVKATRDSGLSRERNATRSALVVVQVALALVLVISAALMVRTFQALGDVDPGFSDPATIQTARIWISDTLFSDPEQYTRMQHEILDKITVLPGVVSAGFASALPMEGQQQNGPVVVEGQTRAGDTPPPRRWNYVSPGYFETMGTRIVAGRELTWRDIESGGRVAVISEEFARELATEPSGALGMRIRFPFDQSAWREIIGVVEGVRQDSLYEAPPSTVYWPILIDNRFGEPAVTFVIRSERAGTVSLEDEVRTAVWSVSSGIPIAQERTMHHLYADSLARTSFTLVLLGIAGAMALTLGIIGIYGVIAYAVSQRAREIGIRAALGARPSELKRMFLLHGLALSGLGAAAGLVAAAALGRLMSSLLFGIGPMNPAVYVAALGVTMSAAALASYLPARRAAMIDPMQTLMKVE